MPMVSDAKTSVNDLVKQTSHQRTEEKTEVKRSVTEKLISSKTTDPSGINQTADKKGEPGDVAFIQDQSRSMGASKGDATTPLLTKSSSIVSEENDQPSGPEKTIKSVCGDDIDMFAYWENNELTASMHTKLVKHVYEQHQVVIPLEFQEQHPSPDHLRSFIELESSRASKTLSPDELLPATRKAFSISLGVSYLHAAGVVFLYLILALCLIPPSNDSQSTCDVETNQSWLPFSLTTVVVVLLKWMIVGRYPQQYSSLTTRD